MPKKSVSIDPLEASLLKGLTQPNAYPHDPSAVQGVEEIQTHISYVFLTRDRVYKFRKAVNLEFLDFRTRAQRAEDCLREVHLNRRLAPDVYLGLAEANNKKGRVRVGAIREHLGTSSEVRAEPCVVMRRLPEGRDTLSLLRQGKLRAAHVLRMAKRIAEFHARHRIKAPDSGSDEEWISKLAAPARACLEHLKKCPPSLVPAKPLADIDLHMEAFLVEHAGEFLSRREHGDFVDGHGDLHLDHCWFEEDDAEPLFIDCIEFRDDFRRIDPASEVAFPFMDFAYRGRAHFGERFLRRYARASDDFTLFRVLDFYITYRALVRSKVAAISACAPELSTQQRKDAAGSLKRHLLLARRTLSRRYTPSLVLVSGIVGSGKSTVAEAVAESLHGVVVSSDVVRKHLAGMRLQDRKSTGWRESLYSEEMTERVYAGLLERALPLIDSGRVAVLDATYAAQAHRQVAVDWAADKGVPVSIIEARCSEAESLRRLRRRQRKNQDPSDAGPEIYAKSRSAYDPLSDLAGRSSLIILSVDTDSSGWRKRLQLQLRQRYPRF